MKVSGKLATLVLAALLTCGALWADPWHYEICDLCSGSRDPMAEQCFYWGQPCGPEEYGCKCGLCGGDPGCFNP